MQNKTRLAEFHESHGASFAEYEDWLLPKDFGDVAAEYRAVRSAVGLIDISHRALLQVTGPDRLSYLQGMLSNDLRVLKPFQGQPAAVLNQQGKVLAEVRVFCAMNSFYLDLRADLKDKVIAHLNRYLVADEVEIADRTEEYADLSLQGPRSDALLKEWIPQVELPGVLLHHAMVRSEGVEICIVRSNHTGEEGYDLIIPQTALTAVARRLTEIGQRFDAAWVGQEALETLRVEAGIPRYGIDFTEDNLLLETGLDSHVSFTKGCYLGQEVVERVRSRGHVNKKLCGLLIEGSTPANPGDAIHRGEKAVGSITSSVYSLRLQRAIALGYVHREHWEPGTAVAITSDPHSLTASVGILPFVKRSP